MAGPAGYYAVDDAPYLRYWDGAVFDPYFWYDQQDTYAVDGTTGVPPNIACSPTDPSGFASTNFRPFTVNDPASPMHGFIFVPSLTVIYVFVNRVLTYSITSDGSIANPVSWGIMYDDTRPSRIYFNLSSANSLGWSDFNGASFTQITTANTVPTIPGPVFCKFNPVNKHKYILSTAYIAEVDENDTLLGFMGSADITACAATLGVTIVGGWQPGYSIQVDVLGNVWVAKYYNPGVIDTTGVADIVVLDVNKPIGTLGTNTDVFIYCIDFGANANVAGLGNGSALANVQMSIAVYPGDGTPGSDRILYTGTLTTGTPNSAEIYAYNSLGQFITYPWAGDGRFNEVALTLPNASAGFYSTLYFESGNTILFGDYTDCKWYEVDGTYIEDVDVNGFSTYQTTNLMNNPQNGEVVIASPVTTGANGTFGMTYISPSTGTIACGNGGIVDMYLTTSGPYTFNEALDQWDSICTVTYTAATPIASQFTVSAILDSLIITQGALIYSTDYGLTWNTATDISGNVYANPAAWATGRVYNNIAGLTNLKISFTTVSDCGLESANIITYIT